MEFFGLGSYPGLLHVFPVSREFFCRGFSWPPSVSCRYVSKTPLIVLDVFCDVFFTILVFKLRWSSIKRSGLLRHNKPEMLLVVICVLLGSLLLRTEIEILYDNVYSSVFGRRFIKIDFGLIQLIGSTRPKFSLTSDPTDDRNLGPVYME